MIELPAAGQMEQIMPTGRSSASPWLLPAVILGGVLMLIGGISDGSLSTVVLGLVATAVLSWTIMSRNRS